MLVDGLPVRVSLMSSWRRGRDRSQLQQLFTRGRLISVNETGATDGIQEAGYRPFLNEPGNVYLADGG